MQVNHESKSFPDYIARAHKTFLQEDFESNKALFASLRDEGQSPKTIWIGCADSRVPAERILGLDPGELFVVRNVANIVPPANTAGISVSSALQFAIGALGVENVIVCSHSDCGGIKALSTIDESPLSGELGTWVGYARPALAGWSKEEGFEALAKLNTRKQIENLLTYEFVKEAVDAGKLHLHACFFGIGSGRFERYDPEANKWVRVAGE